MVSRTIMSNRLCGHVEKAPKVETSPTSTLTMDTYCLTRAALGIRTWTFHYNGAGTRATNGNASTIQYAINAMPCTETARIGSLQPVNRLRAKDTAMNENCSTGCLIHVPRPFSTTVVRENNCLPLPSIHAHFSKRRPKGVHRTLPEKEGAFSIAQDRNLSFLYGSSPATGNRIRAKGVLGCSSRESRGRPRKGGRRARAFQ